ncbi:MAG: hypothetical protein ABJA62_09645 [Luteimonas sp.]
MIRIFVWLCLLLAAPTASAVNDAALHGQVLDDLNGNGVLDASERGIARVSVSNGSDIARTDAQHSVEVRAFDTWRGKLRAMTRYRLDEAQY